jgi:hypothetical protein
MTGLPMVTAGVTLRHPAMSPDAPRVPCADMDPELFFPSGTPSTTVREACRSCPLLTDCSQWGQESKQFGVWGVQSPSAIAHRRREARRAKAAAGGAQ